MDSINPETKFLRIFKNFFKHEIWTETRKFSKAECWIDILNEVRYGEEPENVIIKNKVIECKQGQSLKSLDTWAIRWGMNKSSARRVLEVFKTCNMIRTESVAKTTRLTVLKYSLYRDKRHDNETEMKRKRNDDETEVTPEEEGKEGKEGKDSIPYQEVRKLYNQILGDIYTPIRTISGSRKLHFKARWNESEETACIGFWKSLFKNIKDSDFLTGKNDRGWKADFNWIVNVNNFTKIVEGKYFKKEESKQEYRPEATGIHDPYEGGISTEEELMKVLDEMGLK